MATTLNMKTQSNVTFPFNQYAKTQQVVRPSLGTLVRRYKTRRALMSLNPRQLEDIGIFSREDIETLVKAIN